MKLLQENSASDTSYPSPPPVATHPHPRSKPMKTARKPPVSSKPEHQLPPAGDPMLQQQQPAMQMPVQNNTAGIPQTAQGMLFLEGLKIFFSNTDGFVWFL